MSELVGRIRAALAAPAAEAAARGRSIRSFAPSASVEAAVLIAVTDRAEPGVILTVRREHMRTHAGQIAFPAGGSMPAKMPSPPRCAKRTRRSCSTPRPSRSSARSTHTAPSPATSSPRSSEWYPPDLPLEPHEHEVADLFEAPLAFLLDPANQHLRSALFQGRERHYYEIVWNGRRIWGATAAMIVNLSRRLQWTLRLDRRQVAHAAAAWRGCSTRSTPTRA